MSNNGVTFECSKSTTCYTEWDIPFTPTQVHAKVNYVEKYTAECTWAKAKIKINLISNRRDLLHIRSRPKKTKWGGRRGVWTLRKVNRETTLILVTYQNHKNHVNWRLGWLWFRLVHIHLPDSPSEYRTRLFWSRTSLSEDSIVLMILVWDSGLRWINVISSVKLGPKRRVTSAIHLPYMIRNMEINMTRNVI